MNRTAILFAAISVFVFGSDAVAVKQIVHVTPNETTFKVEKTGENMVRFVITRDPSLTKLPSDNSLVIVRGARLRVKDGKETIVSASIAPRVNNQGLLIYSFLVHQKYVPQTRFTLSEIEDTKNGTGYMGGGTIYEFTTETKSFLDVSLEAALQAAKDADR